MQPTAQGVGRETRRQPSRGAAKDSRKPARACRRDLSPWVNL